MADGRTHATVNAFAASCSVAVAGFSAGDFPFALGIAVGILITPDLDVDHLRTESTRRIAKLSRIAAFVWRVYWWPYSKLHRHGGSSHWPIFGTAIRAAYAFWWVAAAGWLPDWWFSAFVGLVFADLNHLVLDLPRGTNRIVALAISVTWAVWAGLLIF